MSKYVFSSSPHLKSPNTSRRIMLDVCIALLPACVVGCILLGLAKPGYGLSSLLILAIASLSAVAAEFVYLLCCKKSFAQILEQFDFSSLVTGMLVGMNMYATSKWWTAILCSVFAVVVVKMLFGGTGKNIVNPAIAGRIFGFIAFGAAFGGVMAFENKYLSPISAGYMTGGTPLQALYNKELTSTLTNLDLFIGTGVPGCIGEISKIALLAGGIYLIVRGVLNFRWPLVYILTTGVASVAIVWIDGCKDVNNIIAVGLELEKALEVFLPSMLSGGLFLGAIFMATDYVTTPNTKAGNYFYFICLGILTAVLRKAVKGEAVSFAILLMNLVVPLIDQYIVRKPFGYVRAKKVKEAK